MYAYSIRRLSIYRTRITRARSRARVCILGNNRIRSCYIHDIGISSGSRLILYCTCRQFARKIIFKEYIVKYVVKRITEEKQLSRETKHCKIKFKKLTQNFSFSELKIFTRMSVPVFVQFNSLHLNLTRNIWMSTWNRRLMFVYYINESLWQ